MTAACLATPPARAAAGLQRLRRALSALAALATLGGVALPGAARADEASEYRLKAAFLYNFALFTEWPAEVGGTLNMCLLGPSPFGADIDLLQHKAVGARSLMVQRKQVGEALDGCQMVFIAAPAMATLPKLLDGLRGRPVLLVADSPGAARRGVALNMTVAQNRVGFEVNLIAARGAGLSLSSKLLRVASEVIQ